MPRKTHAEHGAGKPTARTFEQASDRYTFPYKVLGTVAALPE